MNANTPCSALVPAAEKAKQMAEGLESLQAGLAEAFADCPWLLKLLMALFAFLRSMAAQAVPADVMPAVAEVEFVAPVIAPMRAMKRAARRVVSGGGARAARRVIEIVVATRVLAGCRAMISDQASHAVQCVYVAPPGRFRRSGAHLIDAKTHVIFVTIS